MAFLATSPVSTTPKYPPGVVPPVFYLNCPLDEIGEVEDYIADQGATDEERDIIEEMNNITRDQISDMEPFGPITDKMNEDMDRFEEWRNSVECLHSLLAKSAPENHSHKSYGGKRSAAVQYFLNKDNRTILEARLSLKGEHFATFKSDLGKIKVDKKFFRIKKFPEDESDSVKMIVALQDVTKKIRWTCIKIL